ncbi:hypothetical protein [Bradyrhizobium sp. CCBAU 11386]|nr:hypothetical protein [Bradyrhizobium sp. CCBAU 11386]
MPAPIRREREARIVAGKRVGNLEIRRACGPLLNGRPAAAERSQKQMAA